MAKSTLQHRHYEEFAEAIRKAKLSYESAYGQSAITSFISYVVKELANTNPNFNAERFKEACGL